MSDKYEIPQDTGPMPKDIVVYQYKVCPFCNKLRAFLDYNNVRDKITCNIMKYVQRHIFMAIANMLFIRF